MQQAEDPHFKDKEKILKEELHVLLEQKDVKWRQKVKENWLKYKDWSTKYFHACANERKRDNQISTILDASGRLCSKHKDIE